MWAGSALALPTFFERTSGHRCLSGLAVTVAAVRRAVFADQGTLYTAAQVLTRQHIAGDLAAQRGDEDFSGAGVGPPAFAENAARTQIFRQLLASACVGIPAFECCAEQVDTLACRIGAADDSVGGSKGLRQCVFVFWFASEGDKLCVTDYRRATVSWCLASRRGSSVTQGDLQAGPDSSCDGIRISRRRRGHFALHQARRAARTLQHILVIGGGP